ncbi:MAG: mechanosensitive ion channel [Paracoccaceae bacterium]|nr:mechanosensitive ion channel [Paracoccaceae bacterium]
MLNGFLNTPILQGKTIGDVLTVQFLAAIAGNILAAVLILFAGFIIAGWINRRIVGLSQRHASLDATLFSFLGSILRYSVLTFTGLFVLNTFGIKTTSIVAVLGAAGLAIGLAVQGTLSNVAAGVMIILFRPFKLGDFVNVDGVSGTVKDITLNFIELATLENIQVIVPNAKVWGNTITNYATYDTRRIQWVFGVSYSTNLAHAEQVIRDTITSDPRAMTDPAFFIQVTNLNDSSVDFTVRCWTKTADAWAFQTDMTRKVKEAFDAAGIDIPFPTHTLIQNRA